MVHRMIPALALLLTATTVLPQENERAFLAGFVAGKYHLIGKASDSDRTYYGQVEIGRSEDGLHVVRTIGGKTVTGTAKIEEAMTDGVPVLRMSFTDAGVDFEETCLTGSDLDNYARITCYLYQPGMATKNPGLEALFIVHD